MSTMQLPQGTGWGRVGAISLGVALIVGVILLAFSWPAMTAEPKNLPVGIVGEGGQVAQVSEALESEANGAVELIAFDGRDGAVTAIEQRDIYGAIVLPDNPTAAPEILTARAANAQVAQMLAGLAPKLQAQIDTQIRANVEKGVADAQADAAAQMQQLIEAIAQGAAPQLPPPGNADSFKIPVVMVTVTDVVPLSDDDPNGVGLTAAAFPLVIGGVLGGIAVSFLITGSGLRRASAVLIYAIAGGLVVTGVLQGLYGALLGNYWINSLAVAAAIAAISGTITGLAALGGRAGAGIGAVFMILIANPISAATVPVEFIAAPWGAIGQWLPPGSAITLIRELSYFPSADTLFPWLVLSIWAVAGVALTLITRRATLQPQREAAPAV